MSSEEWLTLHGRYEKYARPIFRKALRDSYANTLTIIPLINYSNYKELITASFNTVPMNEAYVKVYSKVGFRQYKITKGQIKKDRKQLGELDPEGTFLKTIYQWVQTNLGSRIVGVNDYTKELIQQLVEESLNLNYSVSQMTSYLQRNLMSPRFNRMRSLRIARTETTTAANYGGFKAAGESDLVLDKEWVSVIDDRTRHNRHANHLVQNGKTAPREENFVMSNGDLLMFPGDPKGDAAQVINCRCTIGYVPRRDSNGLLIFKN